MTEAEQLIDEAITALKSTTVGYANHTVAWQNNQTTKWWQGLDKLARARKQIVPPPPAPPPVITPPPPSTLTSRGIGSVVYGGARAQIIPDASIYDALVVSYGDEGTARAKRTLSYVSAVSVNTGWWSGVDVATAKANGLLLKYADGSFCLNRGYPDNFIGDPGSSAYANEWAKQVIAHLNSVGSTSIWMDDLVGTPLGLLSGFPAKYPTITAWEDALVNVFLPTVYTALHAAGIYVAANAGNFQSGNPDSNTGKTDRDWWTRCLPFLDGVDREYFCQISQDGGEMMWDAPSVDAWRGNVIAWLTQIDLVQAAGKDFYGTTIVKVGDTQAMNYARGLYLSKWNGKGGALLISQGGYVPPSGVNPWSTAWTWDLGVPLALSTRNVGLILRDFTNGKLIVNPTLNAITYNGQSIPARSAIRQ